MPLGGGKNLIGVGFANLFVKEKKINYYEKQKY